MTRLFAIALLCFTAGCSATPSVDYQAKAAAAVGGALAVIADPTPAAAPSSAFESDAPPTTINYRCERCRKTITVNPSQTNPPNAEMIHCPTCGDECRRVE